MLLHSGNESSEHEVEMNSAADLIRPKEGVEAAKNITREDDASAIRHTRDNTVIE